MTSLTLTCADAAALRAVYEKDLAKKRVFLAGAPTDGVNERATCELVIEQGGRSHRVAAEVVYLKADDPGRGVGLALASLDAAAMEALRAFVHAASDEPPAEAAAPTDAPSDAPTDAVADDASDRDDAKALNMHERIRKLSNVEQQKMATNGTLPERIALERMYGPNVWETLLKNQRITIPEVARIARKGTLPRPLVEAIGANGTWVAVADVQRALLSNPRSSTAVVMRVLQSMSRVDLQKVPQQTAYPATVRNMARKMVGGG